MKTLRSSLTSTQGLSLRRTTSKIKSKIREKKSQAVADYFRNVDDIASQKVENIGLFSSFFSHKHTDEGKKSRF